MGCGEAVVQLLDKCHQVDVAAAEALLEDGFRTLGDCARDHMSAAQMNELALDSSLPMMKAFGCVLCSTLWCPCKRSRRSWSAVTLVQIKVPDAVESQTVKGALDEWEA